MDQHPHLESYQPSGAESKGVGMYWSDRPDSPTKFGSKYPILTLVQAVIWMLWWLSLVEHVKTFVVWLFVGRKSAAGADTEKWRSIGIDIYQLAKWLFLIVVVVACLTGGIVLACIAYLLASNLFSYFYYHVWTSSSGGAPIRHIDMQRRLIAFLMAFGYMVFGYAVLYLSYFTAQIDWPGGAGENAVSITNALFLSVANTFTLTYGGYGPITASAEFLFASQVLYAFVFLVIIISNSVPSRE